MDSDRARGLFERVKKYSSAGQIELIVSDIKSSLTRFANNHIHQNVAEENLVLSVRVVMEKRQARATTNKTDDESLRRLVHSVEELARVQQQDDEIMPMPSQAEADATEAARPPSRYFDETAAMTPESRADGVAEIVAVAKRNKLVTAGIFASSESAEAVLNSAGLAQFHRQTSSEISITMLAGDSSGWQKANSPDVRQLDPSRLAEIAARKAVDSKSPRELPPGKYTVVLEPAAVLDLVGFMFYDFGGLSLLDQRSFLMNRVGTRLFGENITIWDDAYHALQSGAPFDGEGVRRKRVELVDRGVVKDLVYARATAAKMGKVLHGPEAASAGLPAGMAAPKATGHGFPLPNEMGEAPMNIVFDTGSSAGPLKSVDQMIAETDRGVLVTRLWYIREVEPFEKILTGMTRDGTFAIEGGKVTHGLRNFRFNQSLVEMLQNVEAMGQAVRASGEEAFDMVVPAMKVRDFNFTEVTKF